ncbi:MAG TPA: nuclear transport factor 2 family protein [Steroidobacteraceae bacterium]|nr:nuclear transport factor 2 family protein [Steroidobacteraceae bacterium]
MRDTTATGLEATIREYFDACNEANAAKIRACFEPDGIHYFPAGAPQGTFDGAEAIANGWVTAVRNLGSIWTIDRMVVDDSRLEAVIEWTHFKPKQGLYLRGDEWYLFSKRGLIREIRAYYACPPAIERRTHELGDFDYAGRGYPLSPPPIRR